MIGNNIKYYRQKLGLSQEELGNLLGASKQSVSMYECNTRTPSIDIIIKLAEIFGIDIDTLIAHAEIEVENTIQNTENAPLATSLRHLRKTRGLTQSEIADKIGVSPSAYAMYERGEREPSIDKLIALADTLHVDLNVLFGRESIAKNVLNINNDEIELINSFRKYDKKEQQFILRLIKSSALGDLNG